MDSKNAETLLYQIMSGHTEVNVEGQTFIVLSPTISQKRRASELYQQVYESTAYDMWMTDAQNKALLVSMGSISQDIDENFKAIEERIEDLKVELFDSIFDTEKRDKTRTMLNKVKSKYVEMLSERHRYDAMTRTGYAEIVRTQYLIADSLLDTDLKPVFPNPHIASFSLLEKIINGLNSAKVGEAEMRNLARLDVWKGYWVISKGAGNPFGKCPIELTDDQRLLCQLTRMYDSAYEHPECPDDEIIKDDDAFDGWLIRERRKNEKDKGRKLVDDLVGSKHGGSHEVFVMAKSKKDAARIESANDIATMHIKKQREMALKQHGTLHDGMMPDQQNRIRMETAQLLSQSVKNNK